MSIESVDQFVHVIEHNTRRASDSARHGNYADSIEFLRAAESECAAMRLHLEGRLKEQQAT